jgi:hypothetical protein
MATTHGVCLWMVGTRVKDKVKSNCRVWIVDHFSSPLLSSEATLVTVAVAVAVELPKRGCQTGN